MPNIVEMYENLLGGKAIFKNDDGNLEDSEGNEINIQNIDLYMYLLLSVSLVDIYR